MKLRHISAAATLALFLPFAASALTIEEIQLQISNLLSQITQLQQQLTQTQMPDQIATTPPATACPVFTRTLYRGISGTDVASLQASLGVSQTGYFGSQTEAAVKQMQVQEGIVSSGTAATTGYGSVGPKTRTALLRRCGGGGGTSQSFSASPTFGSAPLAVTFSVRGGKDNYSVDFGDGSTGAMTITGPMMGCPDTQAGSSNPACGTYGLSATHTYTTPGTYTARLNKTAINTCQGTAELSCALWVSMTEIVGTVTITVGGSTSSGAPSISGLDAPTSLSVGQTGTWTVRASVPSQPDSQLSYSVTWGDETTNPYTLDAATQTSVVPIQTNATFTHAYAQAGTYKPVFTVSNSSGSAQTSASVTVTANTSSESALYGTITRTTGNCMPQVVMPGQVSTSNCSTGPVSLDVYLYPQIRMSDYIPTSEDMGTVYSYLFPSYSLSTVLFAVPFTVDFYSTTDSPNSILYFGDGTQASCATDETGSLNGAPIRGSTCRVTHAYTSSGRYTVELRDSTGSTLQRLPIYLPQGGIAPVAHTKSDVNGSYRVAVPPGTYNVSTQEGMTASVGSTVVVGNGPTLHNILINAAAW